MDRPSATLLFLALLAFGPVGEARADAPVASSEATGPSRVTEGEPTLRPWRATAALSAHASLYAAATKVGSRFGLERNFEVMRVESAYAYDLVAHVWVVNQLGQLFGRVNEWAGMEPQSARRLGAWGAAFGSLTYMEVINGFMPNVRFDPYDPAANALGAWLAAEGPRLRERWPWARRFSLEFGYRDWGRVFGPEQSSGVAGNVWHDYPNGRFGLGYGLGPAQREWARVFLTYEITSFELEELENRFGVGVELKPQRWLAPWIRRVPGGGGLLAFVNWWDDRLLLPGLYVQLFHVDTGPFSDREPFNE